MLTSLAISIAKPATVAGTSQIEPRTIRPPV